MSENIQKPEEKKKAKPEVRINGVMYKLRFDLGALEQFQDEYGGTKEAFMALRGAGMTKAVKTMFRICANCQRDYDGMPEDVTEDVIGKHTSLGKLREIADAIEAAMEKGMESETYGGEADDEPQDALAAEYDAKNG